MRRHTLNSAQWANTGPVEVHDKRDMPRHTFATLINWS